MESKRLNRKFSSLFWWFLYSLPLIIFFISLIGTFTIYKETGQDLEFTTEVTDHVISGTGFIADQYVENLYFNTSLSIDEVYSFCDTLNLDESTEYIGLLYLDDSMNMVFIMDYRSALNDGVAIMVQFSNFQGYFFNTSRILSEDDEVSCDGWIADIPIDFAFPVNSVVLDSFEPDDDVSFQILNVDTSSFISTTPFVEKEVIKKVNSNLYEYTFCDVAKTFKPFTWDIIFETIDSTFEKVGFEVSSTVSDFIVLILVWFVQLSFIHLLIDVLLWLPRWLHERMEGVC